MGCGSKPLRSLRVEPDCRIAFPRGAEENVSKALKILNPTDKTIAWKVRTTGPEAVLVKPRAGVLEQNSSVEAEVTLLPKAEAAGGSAAAGGLRLQIQATVLEDGCEEFARTAWRDVPQSGIEAAEISIYFPSAPTASAASAEGGSAARDTREGATGTDATQLRDGGGWEAAPGRERGRGGDSYPDRLTDLDANRVAVATDRGAEDGSCGWNRPQGARPGFGARQEGRDSFGGRDAYGRGGAEAVARQRALAQSSGSARPPARASDSSAAVRPKAEKKEDAMSTPVKVLLGFLIAILVVNLYVRPLADSVIGGGT